MTFVSRDPDTGLRHGGIRWPHGTAPTPFGCRWCGDERGHHGRRWMVRFPQGHYWERPTNTQIKARMLARRSARTAEKESHQKWLIFCRAARLFDRPKATGDPQ